MFLVILNKPFIGSFLGINIIHGVIVHRAFKQKNLLTSAVWRQERKRAHSLHFNEDWCVQARQGS